MPTYEYHCNACKKSYDLQESFAAPTEHGCQKCAKGTAKRVLHAPRVVFKGSGWYSTDSRSTSTAVADSNESPSKDSSSSSDSSSDSGGDSGKKLESPAAS